MRLHASVDFHPVGQGLFSTGRIKAGDECFHWIYDCGTTSRQAFLDSALSDMLARWGDGSGSRPVVDMVVLSHFDHDHISGLLRVLKQFRVTRLVLPHVPFEERLILAFAQGIRYGSRSMRFLLNPVAYLRSLGEIAPEQILLVLAAPPDGAGPDGEPPGAPGPRGDDADGQDPTLTPVRARFEDPETLDGDLRDELGAPAQPPVAQALASGTALRLGDAWEFVPYNDASLMPKNPAAFAKAARRHRDVLLARPDQVALDALKLVYDREFGKKKGGRNIVSLFLYAGNLHGCRYVDWHSVCDVGGHAGGWSRRQYHHYGPFRPTPRRAGFLYTGDGYLDTPLRLRRYLACLGTRRDGANCLQVMHHGSSGNWHAGVAAALRPVTSIFSSNPGHRSFRHPHGEVVRDFLPYQPLQVDSHNGASIDITFY